MSRVVGRFAPTTSGRAHPGTLLAALLSWLDTRSCGGRFLLRMEDIDERATDIHRAGLLDDLRWFGLEWDSLVWQSALRPVHEAMLDALADAGRLYECSCSRKTVQQSARVSAAGGFVYPGTCRHRRIRQWRDSRESIRCDLSDCTVSLHDESGLDLSQSIEQAMGDPVLRSRSGAVTYMLAVVADDDAAGVNRIVRGRDIATATATQVALRQILERPVPQFRHHLLFLEPRGEKFAKLHGSVGADALRRCYSPEELTGLLAAAAGFHPAGVAEPISLPELLAEFSWSRVCAEDQVLAFDGSVLSRVSA